MALTVHNDVLRRFAAGWTAEQEPGRTPERRGPFVPPPGGGLAPRTIAYSTLRALVGVGYLRARTVGAVTTWTASDDGRAYVADLDAKRTRGPEKNRRGGWKAGGRPDRNPSAWEHP